MSSAYGIDGVLDIAEAGRAQRVVDEELDKLGVEWSARSEEFYRRAARIGHDAAERFTNAAVDDRWKTSGSNYWHKAMGWLMEPDGLIGGLKVRVRETLNRASTVQRSRITDVDPTDTAADVVTVVRDTFVAQAARIDNWTGKLIGLTYSELTESLDRTVVSEGGAPVEWMAEWVTAGGNVCPDCLAEGGKGFQPLASIRHDRQDSFPWPDGGREGGFAR
ncbi:MAG: hypothetical protein EBV08_09215 [Synechococcaceae bacterium WB6_1B_055]|nr:hypothetical protein [Synechococcaceae bacterium WB6_1B_055]